MMKDSYIVFLWERLFKFLSYISIFKLITSIRRKVSYAFVEGWVIFNWLFALVASIISFHTQNKIILVVLVSYGMLRIFEIFVYQINVVLFDPYRARIQNKQYKIKSPTRLVILLLHNYSEIIFWFSAITMSVLAINDTLEHTWSYYIRLNFLSITTLDLNELYKEGLIFEEYIVIAFYESIVGFLMTIISLARFISILPGVKSIEKT